MNNVELRERLRVIFTKVVDDNTNNYANIESELEFRISRILSDAEFQIEKSKNDAGNDVVKLFYLDAPPDGIPQIIELRAILYTEKPPHQNLDIPTI